MHYIWIALLFLVVIIDLETSNVLFSWLGIGFLISFILGFFGIGFETQVVVSAISSVPLFLLGSHISRKYIKANMQPHKNNLDKLIGLTIVADSDIEGEGTQKIGGVYWKIQSEYPIKDGEKIRIAAREGNRLIVEKMTEKILEEKEN